MVKKMSVLNQIILGLLLMVTLIVVALMARIYQRTGTLEEKHLEQATTPREPETEPDDA